LSYFSGRGLAECIRIIFAVAEEAYEDERFTSETWAANKPKFNFKKVPCLQLDGKTQICQSRAIERFLAGRFDLLGGNDLETAEMDQLTEQINDIRSPYMQARDKDTFAKEIKHEFAAGESNMEKFMTVHIPEQLALLEAYIAKSTTAKDGHLVGSKLSLVDIQLFALIDFIAMQNETAKTNILATLAKLPKIEAVYKLVAADARVAKWVAARPASEF